MFFKERVVGAMQRGVGLTALLVLCCAWPAPGEKPPVPSLRLPLRTLGFPGHPLALMHAGRSMATLHLLDRSHLLFTYSMRSLVPRIPGDDENDSDRLVAAEIIEVPSGKVVARTEWHLHDYGRYLWSAGNGVFVMRSRDELWTFAPLRGLASGQAFQRAVLPHRPGLPRLVTSSPDASVLMVQIAQPGKESEREQEGDEQPKKKQVVIEFYRMSAPAQSDAPVEFRRAGVIGSPGLLNLALDGDGYLWADDKERNRWALSFNEYEGKPQDLAAIDSSCSPRLELLSRSQFAVLSCRGADDAHLLSAYGFDGHETWEEPFGESQQPPVIVAAPEAGRFAMSRLVPNAGTPGVAAGGAEYETTRQDVRVYQTESGQLLLNVHPAPVMRTAQNFDLSSDGRTLAVLGSESIDFYTLPELSPRDRKDLAEVATMAPPAGRGPLAFRRITRPVTAAETAAEEPLPAAGQPAPAEAKASPTVPSQAAGSGDTALGAQHAATQTSGPSGPALTPAEPDVASQTSSEATRKPPTLLAPGETAEYKPKSQAPQ